MDGEQEIRRGLVLYFGWQAAEANAAQIWKSAGGWYLQPPGMCRWLYLGKTVKQVLNEMRVAGGVRG